MDNLKIEQVKKEIEALTDDEKVAYLFEIIDRESLKPEQESDQELILYCMERADEYSHAFVPQKSEAELDLEVRLIKRRYEKAAQSNKKQGRCTQMPRCHKWVASIAAAVLLFLTISLPAAARAAGYTNVTEFWEDVKVYLSPGDQVDPGGQVDQGDQDDITFIYNGEVVEYDSVEAFLKAENLNIMYPRSLPDDITIEEISAEKGGGIDFRVHFSLSDGSTVLVKNRYPVSVYKVVNEDYPFIFIYSDGTSVLVEDMYTKTTLKVVDRDYPFVVTQNGLQFYIVEEEYAFHFTINEHQYTVHCEDEELLNMIIEGIY